MQFLNSLVNTITTCNGQLSSAELNFVRHIKFKQIPVQQKNTVSSYMKFFTLAIEPAQETTQLSVIKWFNIYEIVYFSHRATNPTRYVADQNYKHFLEVIAAKRHHQWPQSSAIDPVSIQLMNRSMNPFIYDYSGAKAITSSMKGKDG